MPPTIQKIRVTLALKADGALPEPLDSALGAVTVGPHGLLNLLETQLGLPANDVSFTSRLIQYLACIDQVDHSATFYNATWEAATGARQRILY